MTKVHVADFEVHLPLDRYLEPEDMRKSFLELVNPSPTWAVIEGIVRAGHTSVTVKVRFFVNAYEATFASCITNVEEYRRAYEREPFTDEDREAIFASCCDEAADMSRRERGEAFMDSIGDDLPELIGYASPEVDTLGECLRAIHNGNASIEDYESGEFEHHAAVAKEMRKFNLIDADGQLTQLGGEVMNYWS